MNYARRESRSHATVTTRYSTGSPRKAHRTPLRRRIAKFVAVAANLAWLPLAASMPRSPRQWVFGHDGDTFAGNPKYLFLWMCLHRRHIEVAWITESRETWRLLVDNGFKAHLRWSWAGISAALRAKVFVFSHDAKDVNAPLSWGAMRLNLWHGVGLKALQVGRAPGLRGWLGSLLFIPHDRVVTTSDMMQAHFAAQFCLPRERCPQLGYSRLDCAFDGALASVAVEIDRDRGFRMNPEGFAEVYIYMPTFRDTKRPFLDEALPNLERLNSILAARNALLYVKPHPRTAEAFPCELDHIRLWPADVDIYTYLASFTGLITDYSSVLYDYLFLKGEGAILYTFDFEEYVARDRELLYSFDDNVAGLRVSTFDALCNALIDGAAFDPTLAAGAVTIRHRFWGGSSAPASPAIVDYVEQTLRA